MVSIEKYVDTLIAEVKESVKTAYASMEKRLESMNEFRDTLKDQASRFITRSEMESKIDSLSTQVNDLRLSKATLDGKASQQAVTLSLIISFVGILIGIVSIIVRFLPD